MSYLYLLISRRAPSTTLFPYTSLFRSAILNRGNNGRVSGRTPNTALFQLSHQSGFAVTGRGLGKVLSRIELGQRQDLPNFQVGQYHILFFFRYRRQHLQKPIKAYDASASTP